MARTRGRRPADESVLNWYKYRHSRAANTARLYLALGTREIAGYTSRKHKSWADALDAKPEIKRAFTTAERDQIRDALSRYMKERQIGVSILHKEICRHDPLGRQIELKTLQRFLGNNHRTQDDYVSICHEFAKALPYFDEAGSLSVLGASLASFYGAITGAELSWSLVEKSFFDVRFADIHFWGAKSIEEGQEVPFDELLPHATVILEPTGDPRFAVCSEVVQNRFAGPSPRKFPHFHASGVAFAVEPRVLMQVMRDSLTRRPRIAFWTADEVGDEDTLLLVSDSEPDADSELTVPISPRTLRAKPERRLSADDLD